MCTWWHRLNCSSPQAGHVCPCLSNLSLNESCPLCTLAALSSPLLSLDIFYQSPPPASPRCPPELTMLFELPTCKPLPLPRHHPPFWGVLVLSPITVPIVFSHFAPNCPPFYLIFPSLSSIIFFSSLPLHSKLSCFLALSHTLYPPHQCPSSDLSPFLLILDNALISKS